MHSAGRPWPTPDDQQDLAQFVCAVLDLYEDEERYRPEAVRVLSEAMTLAARGQQEELRAFLKQTEDDLACRWAPPRAGAVAH
jgi:hypothetical protein